MPLRILSIEMIGNDEISARNRSFNGPVPLMGPAVLGVLAALMIVMTSCGQFSSNTQLNSAGIRMIGIPSGSFGMGDPEGDRDEVPVRKVKISSAFYISETEVTVEQFRKYRPDYVGFESFAPYVTGVSWDEAMDFCQWLSEEEGKTYRLPTEAEWEYACRKAKRVGLKNMQSDPVEWCMDWYGPYPFKDQADPVGMESGYAKVIRGGLPVDRSLEMNHRLEYYSRPSNRASMAPAFDHFKNPKDPGLQIAPAKENSVSHSGLTGMLFDDYELRKPLSQMKIPLLNSEELSWPALNGWTGHWIGSIRSPHTGQVRFNAEASAGLRLIIGGDTIIDGWGPNEARTGMVELQKDKQYPIKVQYLKQKEYDSKLRLDWEYAINHENDTDEENEGNETIISETIPPDAFSYSSIDEYNINVLFNTSLDGKVREPSIGFRVVQGELPASEPLKTELPFNMQGVRQETEYIDQGPDPSSPWFKKRNLLPIPPDNSDNDNISAAGVDPYFQWHNHCPALTICENGDLLVVFFTAARKDEDEPDVAFGATRLRYGTEQWDMPSAFLDFADVGDSSPMFWNDNGRLWMLFGNLHLDSNYPFQWRISDDNGASWSDVKYPVFPKHVGPHSPQPITTAFRDSEGVIYLSCDGLGPTSLLFTSQDGGITWHDTGGRTNGRHSAFIHLNDGSIAAYGGKHSIMDGFMPKSISTDGGKSYTYLRSPFPALGGNQRPVILRLKSGRLFFACDLQRTDGFQSPGFKERGSLVALSDDEGKTWHMRKLAEGQEHEDEEHREGLQGNTIGYVDVRQARNGIIHLVTSMTDPCLHYEFNEAWILAEDITGKTSTRNAEKTDTQNAGKVIAEVKKFKEYWPNGTLRLEYLGGITGDGRFQLEGPEKWYYPDGSQQYQAEYSLGEKTGSEIYWNVEGQKIWEWTIEDGISTWEQWWPNGNAKAKSTWIDGKCEGLAYTWDFNGKMIREAEFKNGRIRP